MVTAQIFYISLPYVHMTENREPTAVEEHEGVVSQRETETSETQAGIPEDLQESIHMYDKLIAGQVSADAVCLENVLDILNGKLEEQKGAMACDPTACLWETVIFIYSHSRKCCHILLLLGITCMPGQCIFISSKCFNLRHSIQTFMLSSTLATTLFDVVIANGRDCHKT